LFYGRIRKFQRAGSAPFAFATTRDCASALVACDSFCAAFIHGHAAVFYFMAWRAEGYPIANLKSQMRIHRPRLDVVSVKRRYSAAFFAGVIVAMKNKFAPLLVFPKSSAVGAGCRCVFPHGLVATISTAKFNAQMTRLRRKQCAAVLALKKRALSFFCRLLGATRRGACLNNGPCSKPSAKAPSTNYAIRMMARLAIGPARIGREKRHSTQRALALSFCHGRIVHWDKYSLFPSKCNLQRWADATGKTPRLVS
jgi:hypothetical protein